MFRFAEEAEAVRSLKAAGFAEASARRITIHRETTPEALLDGLSKATVRTKALFEAQDEADKPKIKIAILERARALMNERGGDCVLALEMPAVLGVGAT